MRSQKMTFGLEKAPHRSLLYALGLTREEMKRPLIGVVNAANEVVPGHHISAKSPRPSRRASAWRAARLWSSRPSPCATAWP